MRSYIRLGILLFAGGYFFLNNIWCGSVIDTWNSNVESLEIKYSAIDYQLELTNPDFEKLYELASTSYEIEIENLSLWDNRDVCFRFFYEGNYPKDYIDLDIVAFDSWAILYYLFEEDIEPFNKNWYERDPGI